MKKHLLSTILLITGLHVTAQETTISDALRYSMNDLNGTARFRSLSGAFGAVGGDLSAININPAGSAIFNYNSGTGTIGIFNTKNKSSYFGTTASDNESTLDINQLGAVFVFNDAGKSDWKKIAVAINYENTNNFDNSFFARGSNPTTSIGNYFLNYANAGGYFQGDLKNLSYQDFGFNGQQAWLGYQSYIINQFPSGTYNPNATTYQSNIPVAIYNQASYIETTGYNGKLSFNAAGSYKDRIYIGLNLNAHFTDYRQTSLVTESNNGPVYDDRATVSHIRFINDLYTYGGGFSFNLGTIFKVTDELRLGAAYESPTWYRLNDELEQILISSGITGPNDDIANTPFNNQSTNHNTLNIYPTYKVQTPGKFTGSLAYIFGKRGLISIDYSIKDYSQTQFRPKNEEIFNSLNTKMANSLTSASEFRIGGEYKIKQVSLRGGYRFEESPYKNGKTIGDLTGYSAGIGYNFKGSRLDLAYSFAERDSQMRFITSGMNEVANVSSKNNNVLISYTIDF